MSARIEQWTSFLPHLEWPDQDDPAKDTDMLCVAISLLTPLVACTPTLAQEAGLFEQLTTKGIGPIQSEHVALPKPMLSDLDNPAARLEAAQPLAKRIGWDRFAKDSVFAPVAINIDAVKNSEGKRIAHSIHCAFVVHAKLSQLRDQELLKSILVASKQEESSATEDEGQGKELLPEALAKYDVAAPEEGESYGQVTFPLFNRIEVSGVIHAQRVEKETSIGVAWQFDDRFTHDHASVWRKLTKNNLGHVVIGDSVPYTGCGGYMMVQEISPGLLLVESRMVMHEPQEWFNGSQFLRSKLPPGLQENARSFRRKLSDAQKEKKE